MTGFSGGGGGAGGGVTTFNTRAGAVTLGAADIEATFTAAGQVYQGTGSGTGGLVLPPGYEIGYDQITSPVTVTSTTEATPTTIIACAAHTFDGAAVMLEVYLPRASIQTNAATFVPVLFESSTNLGRLGLYTDDAVSDVSGPLVLRYRFTPSAAAHTYTIAGWGANAGGTIITAGVAGSGAYVPAFARFTKV